MSPGFLRSLRLAVCCLVLPSLLGSDCEGPNPVYPERDFVAVLRPAGNLGDVNAGEPG